MPGFHRARLDEITAHEQMRAVIGQGADDVIDAAVNRRPKLADLACHVVCPMPASIGEFAADVKIAVEIFTARTSPLRGASVPESSPTLFQCPPFHRAIFLYGLVKLPPT